MLKHKDTPTTSFVPTKGETEFDTVMLGPHFDKAVRLVFNAVIDGDHIAKGMDKYVQHDLTAVACGSCTLMILTDGPEPLFRDCMSGRIVRPKLVVRLAPAIPLLVRHVHHLPFFPIALTDLTCLERVKLINTIKHVPITRGTELVLSWSRDNCLLVAVDGKPIFTSDSPALCWAVFDSYLGNARRFYHPVRDFEFT